MATATNSPGWYPDPDGVGERWWNGVGWSDARRGPGGTAPAALPTSVAPAPAIPPPAAGPAPGAPTAAPPVLYSASNPAPQHPGQYAAPGTPGYSRTAIPTLDASVNPQSVAAFIAGLIAVFFNVLLVPSILAIVFSIRALTRSNQLRAAGQVDKTRGLAIAGLVMGIVGGLTGLVQGIVFFASFLPLFVIE